MELGVYTFAELTPDARTGATISAVERLRDLLEEVELADQVGLDVFGVGEYHRPDFAVSAPAVVLAAAAQRTTDIRLTSAVSVLGSDDPVRLFHDRFPIQFTVGSMPHASTMRAIELFGTEVAPAVRKELGSAGAEAAAAAAPTAQ